MPRRKKAKTRKAIYLREWRDFRGLTLEKLSDEALISVSQISRIERGESDYTQSTLEILAAALNCTPGDIIERPPDTRREDLYEAYNSLSPEERARAIRLLRVLGTSNDEKMA